LGSRQESFQLIQQAIVPNAVKSFFDVKKDCRAVLLVLERSKDVLRYPMRLLWGSMSTSKSELVVWNGVLHTSYCHHSTKEYSFEYFREGGQ